MGGVWRSTDGGATWAALTDLQPTLTVGAITIDPNTPSTVYAGTGEANFSGDSYLGQGILKSTDAGATWAMLGATTFSGLSIAKIVLDPLGPIYVAASGGASDATGGCDGVPIPLARTGLYKSIDGGASWTEVIGNGSVTDFEVDTSVTPRKLLVSQLRQGVFLVDESTTPATKTAIATLPTSATTPAVNRIEIERSRSNPAVYYAEVGLENNTGTVYLSTNSGVTWALIPGAPNVCVGQCDYDNALAIHPSDPNVVYFGGSFNPVLKLTGGTTATPVFTLIAGGNVHADVHALVFDPQNANSIFVASDGGIAKTIDAGVTWSRINGAIATHQFYQVCVDPTDATIILGGLQDNGNVRKNAGLEWSSFLVGDGTACVVNDGDHTSANRYTLAGSSGSIYRYDALVSGALVFDTSPCPATNPLPGCGDRVGFVAPMTNARSAPLDVYFGTHRLWKSSQGGALGTWRAISPDLTAGLNGSSCTSDPTGPRFDDVIAAIAVAPSDANRIYTGSTAGRVFTSRTGGATDAGGAWTDVTSAVLPTRFVSGLAVDPKNPDVVYVAFSGFSAATPTTPGHIFQSKNGGATWARFDTALDPADLSFNTVVAHPASSDIVYVGTDFGVLFTPDGGRTWAPLGTGLPNVAAYSLVFHEKTSQLFVGTHGRSAWSTKLDASVVVAPAALTFTTTVGKNPPPQSYVISDGDVAGSILRYTTMASTAWLDAPPSAGTVAGTASVTIPVGVNAAGLGVGSYDGTITVSDVRAAAVSIAVHLEVTSAAGSADASTGEDAGPHAPDAPGGCGCETPAKKPAPGLGTAALLALLLASAFRRRRALPRY
jgi:MYXO-CTERM domain-containing protein